MSSLVELRDQYFLQYDFSTERIPAQLNFLLPPSHLAPPPFVDYLDPTILLDQSNRGSEFISSSLFSFSCADNNGLTHTHTQYTHFKSRGNELAACPGWGMVPFKLLALETGPGDYGIAGC